MKKIKRGIDLRRKISFTFLLSVIMFFIVTTILVFTIVGVDSTYKSFIRTIIEKDSVIAEINIAMLESRRSEKDFLLRLDTKYSDRVDTSVDSILELITTLKSLNTDIYNLVKDDEIYNKSKESADNLFKYITEYRKYFTSVKDLTIERGLDQDSNIRGSFRAAAHDLEGMIERIKSQDSMVTYLLIRRNEKDYIIRGLSKYTDTIASLIQRLSQEIKIGSTGDVTDELNSLSIYYEDLLKLVEIDIKIANDIEMLREAVHQIEPIILEEEEDIHHLLDNEGNKLDKSILSYILTGVILSIIMITLNIVLAFIIIKSISNPINIISRDTSGLEEGDLTTKITYDKKDELGQISNIINMAISSFRTLITTAQNSSQKSIELTSEISFSANQTAASTTEITANITSINTKTLSLENLISSSAENTSHIRDLTNDFYQLIQNQASSVEQSTSAVEEITSTINNVSQVARDKSELAKTLKQVTEEGERQINSTNQLINEVSSLAKDIISVTEIINNIASQTNLLAMNAAIEAAHAGDAGKGFAVVADEIRKLAISSADNASKINSLLTEVDKRVFSASEASGHSIKSFMSIKDEVSSFIHALSDIVLSMDEMSQGSKEVLDSSIFLSNSMSEISNKTDTIVENVNEVSESMTQIGNLTSETVSGINEINTAIKDIDTTVLDLNDKCLINQDVMKELDTSINKFKI
ncbi:MAG: methyl-accepting chemotaxis protein [Spirochaetaceae bacterium]